MDEPLEREAVGEAVLDKSELPAVHEADPAPAAYVFDGWGMVPLEL